MTSIDFYLCQVIHRIEHVEVEVESEDLKNNITVFEKACAHKDDQIRQLRQKKAALESKV